MRRDGKEYVAHVSLTSARCWRSFFLQAQGFAKGNPTFFIRFHPISCFYCLVSSKGKELESSLRSVAIDGRPRGVEKLQGALGEGVHQRQGIEALHGKSIEPCFAISPLVMF